MKRIKRTEMHRGATTKEIKGRRGREDRKGPCGGKKGSFNIRTMVAQTLPKTCNSMGESGEKRKKKREIKRRSQKKKRNRGGGKN